MIKYLLDNEQDPFGGQLLPDNLHLDSHTLDVNTPLYQEVKQEPQALGSLPDNSAKQDFLLASHVNTPVFNSQPIPQTLGPLQTTPASPPSNVNNLDVLLQDLLTQNAAHKSHSFDVSQSTASQLQQLQALQQLQKLQRQAQLVAAAKKQQQEQQKQQQVQQLQQQLKLILQQANQQQPKPQVQTVLPQVPVASSPPLQTFLSQTTVANHQTQLQAVLPQTQVANTQNQVNLQQLQQVLTESHDLLGQSESLL